ncbi:hypothetical protein R1flu_018846 [Riccia fluitans]|uniref:Zinc finger protein n=1 Tax=Riccia fluitans TaxID=41844 RepID=A0ABD1ZH63_9MARC
MDVVEDIASPPLVGAFEPIESTPDDVLACEPSQPSSMEHMVHDDHQSPIDIQDRSSVPNYIDEDQHVEESSARNSEGLEMVIFTPRELVIVVDVPYSPESPRDGRQEYDD